MSSFSETCTSWLRSVILCCSGMDEEEPRHSVEKPIVVIRNQPALIPAPSEELAWHDHMVPQRQGSSSRNEKRPASRGSLSGRRRWFPPSRRPQISAPFNFRHLYSDSCQYLDLDDEPQQQRQQQQQQRQQQRRQPLPRRQSPFHPLELSIYAPENNLSPILPHAEVEETVTPPPPAHTNSTWDNSSATLTHERSISTLSFHLPRRQIYEASSSFSSSSPASTPPRGGPTGLRARPRPRAYTSPDTAANHERLIERIASAMIEKERLEAEIESVIERQSIYISSRPSTAYGMEELEPMPCIPALPAAAPSFAERLSGDGRPHTAPSQPLPRIQERDSYMTNGPPSADFRPPPPLSYSRVLAASPSSPSSPARAGAGRLFRDDDEFLDRPLAPPLPLVLRPPLRKKKSFSRVSNWLFPNGAEFHPPHHHHLRDSNNNNTTPGSVTNRPMPVTDREGFYQCVVPSQSPQQPQQRQHRNSSDFALSQTQTRTRITRTRSSTDSVSSPSSSSSSSSSFSSDDEDRDRDRDGEEEEEEEEEGQTVPTTNWSPSPASSPVVRNDETDTPTPTLTLTPMLKGSPANTWDRRATFGTPIGGHRPQSVGVAL